MQRDFHYYATYVLARGAGLRKEASQTIAFAAQYVDDSVARRMFNHASGSSFIELATAHFGKDLSNNLNRERQRKVWVPFHFLPGNEGDTFEERMVCRQDSKIAQELLDHNLCQSGLDYYLELVGITAHTYADTFAHYGFSGISSKMNKVNGSSFVLSNHDGGGIQTIVMNWLREYLSKGLGHGGAFAYPDLPYLKWQFKYENGQRSVRNNQKTYLQGARRLYEMFDRVNTYRPDLVEEGARIDFSVMEPQIRKIISIEANENDRSKAWINKLKNGDLYGRQESIPEYQSTLWTKQKESFSSSKNSSEILRTNIYRFSQAASHHRYFILRDLLPRHDLVVI